MLAHHNFGEFSYGNESQLWSHLAAEWEQNQDLYGMRVLSNPVQEDAVWMNGPPTWSYLQLARSASGRHSALSLEAALEPLKRMSENFRTRLRDPWNLRALTQTETAAVELERGAPREQGHYGFMLTDLYLLPLLSGLRADLARRDQERVLELRPAFAPPFVLPVLLAGCEASLTAASAGGAQYRFRLSVLFGRLRLPAGGLRVCGEAWPEAVALVEDQELSWSQEASGCGWAAALV